MEPQPLINVFKVILMGFRLFSFYIVLLNVLQIVPWTHSERCNGKILHLGGYYGNCLGSLTSPNYPFNYETKDSCKWVIKVKSGFRIELKFTHFDLEGCAYCNCDSVTVRDGKLSGDKVIGKYCGLETPPSTINSSGRYLRVEFDSDPRITKKGFAASYTAFITGEESKCQLPTSKTGNKTADTESTPDGNSENVNGHSIVIIAVLSTIAGVGLIGAVAVILFRKSRRRTNSQLETRARHDAPDPAMPPPPAYSEVVGTADYNYRPPPYNTAFIPAS